MLNASKKFMSLIFLSLFLFACSSIQLEKVSEERHFVRTGETLYFIAWRYGLDYQDLVTWNQISSKSLIYPGQIIKLSGPARFKKIKKIAPKSNKNLINSKISNKNLKWTSPTKGNVTRKFSINSKLFSGILLDGKLGQAVNAASDGLVVYAGNGLVGYGQLIIIEHDKTYLSAYGYNQALNVKEGDWILKGQKIASMGLDPKKLPRLYFEIRRNSDPVDPLKFIEGS